MKKVKWIINDNPDSTLKYADLKLEEWQWYDFSAMFKREFCKGNIDDIWQIMCLNKEVRIYKFR